MADIKRKYGTNNQTITATLASLANNAVRQSSEVDNSSNKFLDVLTTLKVRSGSSGVSTTGYVAIYAIGTVDGGTTRTENAGATDAPITLTVPTNARLVGVVSVVAASTTYVGGPFSVAAAFGGVLPEKWVLAYENKTGAALDATESSHSKLYQGILAEVV